MILFKSKLLKLTTLFCHLILFLSLTFTQSNILSEGKLESTMNNFSSEPYVTGDDGIVKMYVNVIGHVKHPGSYLVYESIDILSLISIAGGPLPGAKLNKVKQFSGNEVFNINVKEILTKGNDYSFKLNPHNTIYIQQSRLSYIFETSNLLNSILQVINIYFSASNIN